MDEIYGLYHNGQKIGSAQVQKCGLYYQFSCRCNLSSGTPFTVEACRGGKAVNLGICVPCGDSFGLQTRVPMKRLGEGEWHFSVQPKHKEPEGLFCPIRADEPFAYIDRLTKACLSYRDGQMGIVIRD